MTLLVLVPHSFGGTDILQLNCEMVPLMVIRPHDGRLAVLFGLSFQIEQDFKGTFCHNSKNFTANTFVRVICCCEIWCKKLKNKPLKKKFGKCCGNDLVTQLFPNFAFSCGRTAYLPPEQSHQNTINVHFIRHCSYPVFVKVLQM